MCVELKNADCVRLHKLRDIGFDPRHQKRAEVGSECLLVQHRRCPNQSEQKPPGVPYPQAHFAAGSEAEWEVIGGLKKLCLAVSAPTNCHLLGLIDKVDLAVKRRFAVRRAVQKPAEQRRILRFQCVASGSKRVERLPIQKQHSLLRLVDNKLRVAVEIFAWMFPYKCGVVTLVFENICNMSHNTSP